MVYTDLLLIVGGSSSDTKGWSTSLAASGWTIVTVSAVADLVSTVSETHPQLIILEVLRVEPGITKALLELKQNKETQAIPVLIVSGISERDCFQLLDAGADAFCARGALTPTVLAAIIGRVLRNQRLSNAKAHVAVGDIL
jgi:DNA-binding response OmpR family regulator